MNDIKRNEIEKNDAFSDIDVLLSKEYILIDAIDYIAKCYNINAFQLALWYANYKDNK